MPATAERIQQRTPNDCVIATIAMATGRSYEDVHAVGVETGRFVPEKGCSSELPILEALGYDCTFENGRPVGDFVCRHRGFEISPEFFREFAWGRRAIFTVPSLNIPDGHHSVYWDGREVFDPSPPDRKLYTEFAQLKPSEVILFRERP